MNINNTSNTNFKGTFILNPQNLKTKEAIPNIVKQGRQLFYNIKHPGDVVLVTKDKYDRRVSDFIGSKKLTFEYYPEISTKSGLDSQKPFGLTKLLCLHDSCVVKNLKLLKRFLSGNPPHLNKQSEYLSDTLKTLRLNINNHKIEVNNKGIFTIRDDAQKRTIKSTGFKDGMTYVYIRPDAPWGDSKRFLVGQNGKKIVKEYQTPREIMEFDRAFKKIIESN